MLPDGVTPRVWKLSEVGAGYHKKGDLNPKIAGLHPHCRCCLTSLLNGFGFNSSGMVTYIGKGHDEFAKQRGMVKSEDGLAKSTRETLTSGLWDKIKEHVKTKYNTHILSNPPRENTERLGDIIQNSPIAVHVQVNAVDGICADGRLKTQFDTGTSGGALDPDHRRKIESALFGVPSQTDANMRPVYGAVHARTPKETPIWHLGPAKDYGDIWLELHPHVKERSTFTNGDSFGANVAMPNDYLHKHGDRNNHYIEAQIHGGVYLDKDVKAIHASHRTYAIPQAKQKIMEKAKQLGERFSLPVYFHHVNVWNHLSHTETLHDPSKKKVT